MAKTRGDVLRRRSSESEARKDMVDMQDALIAVLESYGVCDVAFAAAVPYEQDGEPMMSAHSWAIGPHALTLARTLHENAVRNC